MITTIIQSGASYTQPNVMHHLTGRMLVITTSDIFLLTSNVTDLLVDTRSRLRRLARIRPIQNWVDAKPNPIETALNSIHSPTYVLKRPIPVKIEAVDDDEYLVTSIETGIAISASSPTEALQLIRIELVEVFELYKSEVKLGPEPARQLAILESYFGKERRQQTPA